MQSDKSGRTRSSERFSTRLKTARIEKKRRRLKEKKRSTVPFLIKLKLILATAVFIAAVFLVFLLIDSIGKGTDVRLTDAGLTHSDRFRGSIAINGIDVSVHQGDGIKWPKVKSSGADFVFIRAGFRDAEDGSLHEDATFKSNVDNAHDAGLMTGAYFFSQALTPEEAAEEAGFLLEVVDGFEIDLPLVIDFELYDGGRLEKMMHSEDYIAASQGHDIVLAFCRRVEEAGYESAVYSNYDMFSHYMDAKLLSESATLWLAQYGGSATLDADYLYWQCSDSSQVGGIKGTVDHDIWYIEPGRVYPTRAAGKGKNQISIGDCSIHFSKDSYKLSRHRAVPKISMTNDGRHMRKGKDYFVSVINNTASGTGYVIVRGKGLYKDWTAIPFTIE